MERQLFGFFKPVHGASKRRFQALGVLGLLVHSVTLAALPAASPSSLASSSPSPSVDLSLPAYDLSSPSSLVRVGDAVELQVLNPPQQVTLDTTTLTESDGEGWSLISAQLPKIVVSPVKVGKWTLPSLGLKDASGKSVGRTNPLTLEVQSAIPQNDPRPDQPEGAEPPIAVAYPTWFVALLLLIGAGVLIAAGYGIYRWLKNRKPKEPKRVEVVLSEDEKALHALTELEKRGLLLEGQFKVYYFKLSEIAKEYIGARYRVDALESTTREIVNLLNDKRILSEPLLERLESSFDQLDLVKFTDHVPHPSEGEMLLSEMREFVKTTRRVPSIVDAAGVSSHAVR